MEVEDFIESGFLKHKTDISHENAAFLLQKSIINESSNRIKYYVNVYVYDHRRFGIDGLRYMAEMQFNRGEDVFNVTILYPNSLKQVLDNAEEFWIKMGMDYKQGE